MIHLFLFPLCVIWLFFVSFISSSTTFEIPVCPARYPSVAGSTGKIVSSSSSSSSSSGPSVSSSSSSSSSSSGGLAHFFLIAGQSNTIGYNGEPNTIVNVSNPRILTFSVCDWTTTLPVSEGFIAMAVDPLPHSCDNYASSLLIHSNGYAIPFANQYLQTIPAQDYIVLIPCGWGGTGFTDVPQSGTLYGEHILYWDAPNQGLFLRCQSYWNKAWSMLPTGRSVAKGILWLQGELEGQYDINTMPHLTRNIIPMVAYFRNSTVGMSSSTPFVAGEMTHAWVATNPSPYGQIQNAIDIINITIPFSGVATSVGLAAEPTDSPYGNVHYDSLSQAFLGNTSFWNAYQLAVNNDITAVNPPVIPTQYYNPVDYGLLNYLTFNGTTNDLIGNVASTVINTGTGGNAPYLSGQNSWIIPTYVANEGLQLNGNLLTYTFSQCAYFKPISLQSDQILFGSAGAVTSFIAYTPFNNEWASAVGSYEVVSSITNSLFSYPVLQVGTWYHLCYTYDTFLSPATPANVAYIYLDGVIIAYNPNVPTTSQWTSGTPGKTWIGGFYSGANTFVAEYAAVRIYNYSIPLTLVQQLMTIDHPLLIPSYQLTSYQLNNGWYNDDYHKKLSRCQNELVTIAIIGDSITQGSCASNLFTPDNITGTNYVDVLAQNIMSATGCPSGGSGWVGIVSNALYGSNENYDNAEMPVVITGTWVPGTYGTYSTPDSTYYASITAGSTITATVNGTNISVYYVTSSLYGLFNISIDGNFVTQVNSGIGTTTLVLAYLTFTVSPGTHTILIYTIANSGKQTMILGFRGSNAVGLMVDNFGANGLTLDWLRQSTTPNSNPYISMDGGGFDGRVADLVIINLGVNDALVPVAVSTYISDMQAAVEFYQGVGVTSILIVSANAGDSQYNSSYYIQYQADLPALATSLGVSYINLNNIEASDYVSLCTEGYFGVANSNPNCASPGVSSTSSSCNAIHPSSKGHWNTANVLTPFVNTISNE